MISALEPLKSKRFTNSFLAWFTAFSTSIEFTSETMSKDGMARAYALAKVNQSAFAQVMVEKVEIASLEMPELEPYRTMRWQFEQRRQGLFVAEGEKVV